MSKAGLKQGKRNVFGVCSLAPKYPYEPYERQVAMPWVFGVERTGKSALAGLAVFSAALALVLVAGFLHHSHTEPTTLVVYDRFGIPVPGTDDPLPRRSAAVTHAFAKVKPSNEKRLEQHENALDKTLEGIETQVKPSCIDHGCKCTLDTGMCFFYLDTRAPSSICCSERLASYMKSWH
jgi:hypothetical protein